MNTTRDKFFNKEFKETSVQVVPLTIQNRKINRDFNNYKIVHITDIHIGQWITKEKLDGIIKIINKLEPDTIVLTGDYVSYETDKYLEDLEDALKHLKSKDVTLSVLGNHDYWTEPEKIKKILRKCNIINLENDIYTINRGESKLQIAGIDCVTENKDNLKKIEEKLDYTSPAIMLVHEPDFADKTCKLEPFILQLSGHSHGGQLGIPKIRTPIRGKNFIKYPLGKYEVENMIQYTNPGIGTNMFWFRINCPPEITEIILKQDTNGERE